MTEYSANRKLEYYAYILRYYKARKRSPVIRDIAENFNTSTSVVKYYLDQLTEDGLLLEREHGESRVIVPTEIADAIDAYFAKA